MLYMIGKVKYRKTMPEQYLFHSVCTVLRIPTLTDLHVLFILKVELR